MIDENDKPDDLDEVSGTPAEAEAAAEDTTTTDEVAEAPEAAAETPAEPTEEPVAEATPEAEPAEETPEDDADEDDEPVAAAPAPKPVQKTKPAPVEGDVQVVRAQAKYVRTSARKARLVCDHLRGKSVEEARAILAHANRNVAQDWSKLLESAVANAEHNHELIGEDLKIHAVYADEGPTLKRFRPRAMGRATQIRKRTSHLSIALTPKEQ